MMSSRLPPKGSFPTRPITIGLVPGRTSAGHSTNFGKLCRKAAFTSNSPAVTAFNGPVNLNWMMTGPQADFWPSQIYTGQFYSENTPMRILAWRGQVVEGFGATSKKLMGTIADRTALGELVRADDWNQYTVIARGGVLIHILNGQLMAVLVDDDPLDRPDLRTRPAAVPAPPGAGGQAGAGDRARRVGDRRTHPGDRAAHA